MWNCVSNEHIHDIMVHVTDMPTYVNTTPVLPGSIIAGAALAEIMHRVKCLNAEKQKKQL